MRWSESVSYSKVFQEKMYQIGVDVLPEYRRRGIAAALTSHLALEILKNPRRYIAEEDITPQQLPILRTDGVSTKPARCDFRAYTVHSDSLRVWMGGLSRYTVVTSQGQSISGFKDTWVMSE